ncbi:MAG: class I SAM-dependent methyltransferase [Deltaproteobacteria bacterium]|nr:class I SAM-dependent methyltransferase [Deltaproteobacteria bacterium]
MINAASYHQSMHVSESDLEPSAGNCPLCGDASRSPIALVQRGPDVTLLRCGRCHGASADRFPKQAVLDRYYAAYYAEENPIRNTEANVTLDKPERLAQRILEHYESEPSTRTVRILDFGGGDGTLSKALAQQLLSSCADAAHIRLCDYSAVPFRSDDGRLRVEVAEDLASVGEGSFDIAIASGILEHLCDPVPELQRMLSLLRPGGIFYARTPAVAEILRLTSRLGIDFDITFPGHVHDLGQAFWDGALRNLPLVGSFRLIRSTPSIVETTFDRNPARTVIAHLAKAPWWLLGRRYKMVGGWEVIVEKERGE